MEYVALKNLNIIIPSQEVRDALMALLSEMATDSLSRDRVTRDFSLNKDMVLVIVRYSTGSWTFTFNDGQDAIPQQVTTFTDKDIHASLNAFRSNKDECNLWLGNSKLVFGNKNYKIRFLREIGALVDKDGLLALNNKLREYRLSDTAHMNVNVLVINGKIIPGESLMLCVRSDRDRYTPNVRHIMTEYRFIRSAWEKIREDVTPKLKVIH